MTTSSETYNILVDVIIPIATFIVGLIVERKWSTFQIHNKGKIEQSQKIRGDNNKVLQMQGNYSFLNYISSNTDNVPNQLPYKENQFVEKVVNILKIKNITSNFADDYKDGYKHLINNCPSLAASSYLSAFLQVKEIFLTKANYRTEVNENLIKMLESNFRNLQKLSDDSINDKDSISKVVNEIEKTLNSLFAYFNYGST